MSGKGDKIRPSQISIEEYGKRYDEIFKEKPTSYCYEPPEEEVWEDEGGQ